MPADYLSHLALFVCAIYIFTSDSIPQEKYTIAKDLLIKFHKEFSDLYGRCSRTHVEHNIIFFVFLGVKATSMNVHLLQHLPECVRLWGPLWSYSCFHFENLNGYIKSLFHGTRDMTKQVANVVVCRLLHIYHYQSHYVCSYTHYLFTLHRWHSRM